MSTPLYVRVEPVGGEYGSGEKQSAPGSQVPLVEQLEKADTLSYQLPDAETEVRRLEDLRRTLDKDLLRFRPQQRAQHAVLSEWLSNNQELSLVDAGLGDSDLQLKNLQTDDSAGLGRYAMRGDLRAWMDRVCQLDATAAQVAGEWSPEDIRRIEDELRTSVRQQVARDAERKRQSNIDYVQTICGDLAFISEGRDFTIDSEFVTDDTDQLKRLAENVSEWRSCIERFGHPGKLSEKEITRRVRELEERRKQTKDDVLRQAEAAGKLLSSPQVDQVLDAIYSERCPPNFLSKNEKERIQQTMVVTNRCAEAQIAKSRRQCDVVLKQMDHIRTENKALRSQLADYVDNPKGRQEFVEGLEQSNAQMQVAAEVLARKRVRECEETVQRLQQRLTNTETAHDAALERMTMLATVNDRLTSQVEQVSNAWESMLGLKQSHEKELAKIHGGQVSQLQRVGATLSAVMSANVEVLNRFMDASESLPTGSSTSSFNAAIKQAVSKWRQSVRSQGGLSDGARSATDEVLARSERLGASGIGKIAEATTDSTANRQFVDGLLHRVDVACGELQAKHREQRYMKKIIAYFVKLIGAMMDNSYEEFCRAFSDSVESKKMLPFPPDRAVSPDESYGLIWNDELKALERLALQLRPELSDTVDRTGAANALLGAVEVFADASHRAASPPKSPTQVGGGRAKAVDTSINADAEVLTRNEVQVKRDARLMLFDAKRREARAGGASILEELRRDRRPTAVTPEAGSSDKVVDLFHRSRRESTPTPVRTSLPPLERPTAKVRSHRTTKL